MLKSNTDRPYKVSLSVIAFVLWLATAALGIWNILVIRSMVLRTYVRFLPVGASAAGSRDAIPLINTLLVITLAIVWIAIAIGGAEYHYKRVGQPGSWKLFGRTLAAELSILVLAMFV